MKLGVLYSGGKDSTYALFKAKQENEIKCLLNIIPNNKESYMFQNEANNLLYIQSKALEVPLIQRETQGEKEIELKDLKELIKKAKQKFGIEGIVTGAIKSVYQSSRIQKICAELDLWCFNPLWEIDEENYLKELLDNNFKIIIVGIAAYPLTREFLGAKLNSKMVEKLSALGTDALGEGGEFETLVINSPLHMKSLEIIKSKIKLDSENSGELIIEEVKLK